MKNIKTFALFLLAGAVLSSCGGLNKMVKESDQVSYQVTPEVLQLHGGEVDVAVDVNYPAKYFNKKAVVTLTPVLKYEGGETKLEPIKLQGQDVTENNKVISYDNGGKANFSGTFDYEDEMIRSELYVSATAKAGNKSADLGEVKLADGIIATPLLVQNDPKVILFADNFQRIVPELYQSDINYVINRADVRRAETNKEGMQKLNQVLKNTEEDERLELDQLTISAYASPDGPVDLNANLSEKRRNTANSYMQGQLRKTNLQIAEEIIQLTSTPEDWEGFKELVQESSIPDKELILRVLSMHSDPVVREQEIKNLSAAFEVLKDEILPKLRRSKFIVEMNRIGLSDEELKSVWSTDKDSLDLEELLYTATLVENLETQAAIYSQAIKVSPQSDRAHSNLGAVLFMQGKTDQAEKSFNDAKKIRDHDIVNNNLGAVALKNGEVEAAKEAFTASLGAGDKVNYNLGIVNIMQGDYQAAVNYFGSEASFNAALARYLAGNEDAAWRTAAALDTESAWRYYLLAVIAAGQDKPDVVVENLKKAVANSDNPAQMKQRAQKDLEFAKLWNTPDFQAAVQ